MLRMVEDDGRIVYGSNLPHSLAKVVIEKRSTLKEMKNITSCQRGLIGSMCRCFCVNIEVSQSNRELCRF